MSTRTTTHASAFTQLRQEVRHAFVLAQSGDVRVHVWSRSGVPVVLVAIRWVGSQSVGDCCVGGLVTQHNATANGLYTCTCNGRLVATALVTRQQQQTTTTDDERTRTNGRIPNNPSTPTARTSNKAHGDQQQSTTTTNNNKVNKQPQHNTTNATTKHKNEMA